MESLIYGPGYNPQWNQTSLSNLYFINSEWSRPFEKPFFYAQDPLASISLSRVHFWMPLVQNCKWLILYSKCVFALVVRTPVHCIFVDKLLNIYIIYFVPVSLCSLRPQLTAVFRQNAGRGYVCVKELQCGSPLGLRKRDPPIIQVEIQLPTCIREYR